MCCAFCFKTKADKKKRRNSDTTSSETTTVGDDVKGFEKRCSMKYKLQGVPSEELATFGAGCYWGTEKWYVTNFQKKFPDCLLGYGVGFMSADENAPANPTYRQVCSKETSFVEVLHMRFDNTKVKYEDLVKHFFTFHDPTTFQKQGNDTGPQYASVIFYHSDK